jgi:hypothetical protein
VIEFRDEFLGEEDLDLRSLTDEELAAVWMAWLIQAQATNEDDKYTYSHGVFTREPAAAAGEATDEEESQEG